ncbi:MAG TPA: tetratricopeptide repeat protein [Pirellulales bacterium]|nr:tetratricopeptide repeat protein [Pirellulales bacterium]
MTSASVGARGSGQARTRRGQAAHLSWSIGRLVLASLVLTSCCGCRLPVYGGSKSRSVLTSRQLSQQGASALYRQDWTTAEKLFARAVEACPQDVDARRQYAETLWHRGARTEATAQLAEAVKEAPEDARLLDRLAEFHLVAGQLAEARHDAELAIDLEPKSADAWMVRGRIMRQLGDNRQALADLHRALSYDPRNTAILHELARTYLAIGEPDRALANLHSVLEQHAPGDEPAQLMFETGLAYAGLHRFDEAVESYHHAIARDQGNPEILYCLSEAEMARGNTAEARIALEQAAARDPGNPRYQELMARLPGRGPAQSR